MIVVTGIMRSGTTPLAMMLHNMGVTMGTYMRFPFHSAISHREWEDVELAEPLAAKVAGVASELDVKDLFRAYIPRRQHAAHGRAWGVKTPYLLPFTRDWLEACEENHEDVRIALTLRDPAEAHRSIVRQLEGVEDEDFVNSLEGVLLIQKRLESCWASGLDNSDIFELQDTHKQPHAVAARLADMAGVVANYDHATRGIHGGESQWV